MNRQIALRSAVGAAMLLGTAGAAFPWHDWQKSGVLTTGVLGYYYTAAYTTLYSFTGTGADGGQPLAGLVAGPNGTTFGTTSGTAGAFLTLPSPEGSNPWTVDPIAVLQNGAKYPLTIVNATTLAGVEPNDVFTLTYDATSNSFNKVEIFAFPGGNGGTAPTSGLLLLGNSLWGTASGGSGGGGILYRLQLKGGKWREAVQYAFTAGGATGDSPVGNLVPGKLGNFIYGTTAAGGKYGKGTLFAAIFTSTGAGVKVLHSFAGGNDGATPGGLVEDKNYNLYGATSAGGAANDGTVFEYAFKGPVYSQLYSFVNGADGNTPFPQLAIDAGGALYGTAKGGANGQGTAYVLEPPTSKKGQWTMDVLHAFSGTTETAPASGDDGASPSGALLLDSKGEIFGTTTYGGAHGWGTVYKLVPGSY